MNTALPFRCYLVVLSMLLLSPLFLPAQQINLSLHPTAVPDSFVVRATSVADTINGLPNAVFTLRWELEAGGEVSVGDVRIACESYSLQNYGGMVDVVNHRYFPLLLFGERPLEMAHCPITPEGIDIAGIRIRELVGCRHVELVQNAYTGLNNLDYYFSMGGIDMTGEITSDPISGGECGPCEAPVITAATAVQAGTCEGPTDLQMVVEGDAPDFSWYALYSGEAVCDQPSCTVAAGISGPFLAVSTNACGVDSVIVEVDVDTATCVPPVITMATFSFITQGIKFTTTATGTCLEYRVVAPNGITYTVGWNGNITVPDYAELGEYLAIATNACGADTVVFLIEETPQCDPPQITSASASVPGCQYAPLVLTCTATGQGAIGYEWKDPLGTVVGTTANTTVPEGMTGNYSVTVSNACGANWALVPLLLDTAGLSACVPPEILAIHTNGPVCAGDTVMLDAEVVADGPCLDFQWSGTNVVQSGTAVTVAPEGEGDYTLTVSNACGSTAMSIASNVLTLQYADAHFCGAPSAPLSMDSLINYEVPGGSWYFQGEPHANHFDPTTDSNGPYFVHHPELGCPVVRLFIMTWPYADAGIGASITVCSTDDPINLFSVLGGDPVEGGAWTYGGAGWLSGGVYDPAVHHSNTYVYRVDNPACSDTAHVVVTEIPATAWYADGDGDGYGDDSTMIMACEQPEGYVATGGDDCPDVHGLIGDECDDGDPSTVNDVINEECLCEGDRITGLVEQGTEAVLLWPNPNRDGTFYLQLPQATESVSLTVTDATGRPVLRTSLPASSVPTQVILPDGLATGTYLVWVVTDNHAETMRLVVE